MTYSYNNQPIANMKEWEDIVYTRTGKSKDWKHGRSAYSIAEFMLHGFGEAKISEWLGNALGERVKLICARPELEVSFDKHGRGRVHDLAIHGTTETGESVFIGVESKVDETFGATIGDAYLNAKTKELNGIPTNAPKRIEALLRRNFGKIQPRHFDLRYQLLYATVGTLAVKADISVLLVIVFKTSSYRNDLGAMNHQDYTKFCNALKGTRLSDVDGYRVQIEDKTLHMIHREVSAIISCPS